MLPASSHDDDCRNFYNETFSVRGSACNFLQLASSTIQTMCRTMEQTSSLDGSSHADAVRMEEEELELPRVAIA